MKATIVFKKIDVRKLREAGEEPFPLIRKQVDALQARQGLEVIAPFPPMPLIELLSSEGFQHSMDHDPDGSWVTRFWRE
jgi:uncharacterized protein (DUF2249 family)